MSYRALPAHLHAVADHARSFLTKRGVASFAVETEIDPGLSLRPTLHGQTRDYHIVCVEVTDSGYTDALDRFVLDCQRLELPVKLFIAVPAGIDMTPILRRALPRGVGVLEVGSGGSCNVFCPALSLSLASVRRPDLQRFPRRYRQALSDAENTFLGGDPVKGCSRVYDEIEALTRRLAQRAWTNGLLGGSASGPAPLNFATAPWKSVLDHLRSHLDYKQLPTLNDQLLSRVIGLTPFRNQTGHKVSRKQDLVRRDKQLRTRFEDAVDVLEELVNATRRLRI